MYWIRIEFLEFLAIRISSCSQSIIYKYIYVYRHIPYELIITVVRVYVYVCVQHANLSVSYEDKY